MGNEKKTPAVKSKAKPKTQPEPVNHETKTTQGVIVWGGVEYPVLDEPTARELVDAERWTGRNVNELTTFTASMLFAYFTLRRAGAIPGMDFDAWLDEVDEDTLDIAEVEIPPTTTGSNETNGGAGTPPSGHIGTPD